MSANCIIRIYANDCSATNGWTWANRELIWRSDRIDESWASDGREWTSDPIYDANLSCEIGKAATLKFTIGPDHHYYSQFKRKKTLITVTEDGTTGNGRQCLFRGPVQKITVDIYQQMTIEAEGALTFLKDSLHVPTGRTSQKKTRKNLFLDAISEHSTQMNSEPYKKFTVDTNKIGSFQGNIDREKEYNDTSYTDTMSFINSNVMDECSGYLMVRYTGSFENQYLDFPETFNTDAEQQIKFAVNLQEISREDNMDDIYTVLTPVGKEAKIISGLDGTSTVKYRNMAGEWTNVQIRVNGKNIEIPEAIAKYGYIYKPVSFSDKSTPADILDEAKKYISNTYRAERFTVTVKALDLHYLDSSVQSLHIGDRVTVYPTSRQTANDQIVAICSAIDYDLTSPENNEYTIGTGNESLTSSAGGGGGGGSSGSSGGGGWGGAVDQCIGYIDGTKKIIDGDILQINTRVTEINSAYTYINSSFISLANRVTITEQQLQSMYADMVDYGYWIIANQDTIYEAGEIVGSWQEFEGSNIYQWKDHIANFVGKWKEKYGPPPENKFLGYEFEEGGGLFIYRDNASFGLWDEGNLTGGIIVDKINGDEVTTTIRGDHVNIEANRSFSLFVQGMRNPDGTFNTSGITINEDQCSFGFYKANGTGGQELTAGILVNTLSDGSTVTKIKSDYIDFEGKVTAQFINSLYAGADALSANDFWAKNSLFVGSSISSMFNLLNPDHHILDTVLTITSNDHPSYTQGGKVHVPYKRLSGEWTEFSFDGVASVSGSWSDGSGISKFQVTVGSTIDSSLTQTVGVQFVIPDNNPSERLIQAYYTSQDTQGAHIGLQGTTTSYILGTSGNINNSDTTVQMQYASGAGWIRNTATLKLYLVVDTDGYVYIKTYDATTGTYNPVAKAENTYAAPTVLTGRWDENTGYYRVYSGEGAGETEVSGLATNVGLRWMSSDGAYNVETFYLDSSGGSVQSKTLKNTVFNYKLGATGSGNTATVQLINTDTNNKILNTAELSLYLGINNDTAYITANGSRVASVTNSGYQNGIAYERGEITTNFYTMQNEYYIGAYDTTQDTTHVPKLISTSAKKYKLALTGSGTSSVVAVQDVGGTTIGPTLSVGNLYIQGQNSIKLNIDSSNHTISASTSGTTDSVTISARINQNRYNEGTHTYTARGGAYVSTMSSAFSAADPYETGTEAYEDGWIDAIETVMLSPSSSSTIMNYGGSVTVRAMAKSTFADANASEQHSITITAPSVPTMRYGYYDQTTWREGGWTTNSSYPRGVTYAYMKNASNTDVGSRIAIDGTVPYNDGWGDGIASTYLDPSSNQTISTYGGTATIKLMGKATSSSSATQRASVVVTAPAVPTMRYGYYNGSTWNNAGWKTDSTYKYLSYCYMRNGDSDVGTEKTISGLPPYSEGWKDAVATITITAADSKTTLGPGESVVVHANAKSTYSASSVSSQKTITITASAAAADPTLRWGYYNNSTWNGSSWTTHSSMQYVTYAYMRRNNADVGSSATISGLIPYNAGFNAVDFVEAVGYGSGTGSSATASQTLIVSMDSKKDGTARTKNIKLFFTGSDGSDPDTITFNETSHKASVYVRIHASNSTRIMYRQIDATSVYNQGKADGGGGGGSTYSRSATLTNAVAAPSEGYTQATHQGYHWVKKSNGTYERLGTSTSYWYYSTTLIGSEGGNKTVHYN